MLFIHFYSGTNKGVQQKIESQFLTDEFLAPWQDRYVWAKLPVETTITEQGRETRLLDHAAFAHMGRRAGIAILDFESSDAHLRGHVVSSFPYSSSAFTARQLTTILGLPKGTITQRTMIYAVRVHPESPASTQCTFHPALADEAASHSQHQASIGVQGHHAWDSRFHRINGRVGGTAREVVAESWPNEDLVTACIDCVHSWRQSSGHWSAVQGRHRVFGYDIKRGGNGIWYATGIFAR